MIKIKGLSLRLGEFSLENINLDIEAGEYFVILGPTGAGKTVLLESLAGLHKVKQGEIWLDGKNATFFTPEIRRTGYVPQDYVLFPFLKVKENITFGLKNNHRARPDNRVEVLAEMLGITHLLERNPATLSGGEKQRVALARALVMSPPILLLDEPLGSLDTQTAKHLRLELKRLHRELALTTVHITHNQSEAEEMADRIGVLFNGKLEQTGKPHEIFFTPENDVVSEFIGAPNILECASSRILYPGLVEVTCGEEMRLIVPHDGGTIQQIAVLPRDVYVYDAPPPGPPINRVKGFIKSITAQGPIVKLEIRAGGVTLRAEMLDDAFKCMALEPGKEAYLNLKLRRIQVYDQQSRRYES